MLREKETRWLRSEMHADADADDKPPLEVVESLHVEKDLFPSRPHANWPHG